MEYSGVQLNDLPDEILMIIFKKIYNVEVLYCLFDANKRLNKILYDPIFTSHLTLLQRFWDDSVDQLPDPMLDRFCLQILPKIHDKIKCLYLESSSMERILLSTNYPNLYGLALYELDIEQANNLFTDATLIHRFKNQISSLLIDITENEKQAPMKNVSEVVFTKILTMFANLNYLDFGPSSCPQQCLSFDVPLPLRVSSSLLQLRVSVDNFLDCLYLLDGCFDQLRALHINISNLGSFSKPLSNKGNIPNLRFFALFCDISTSSYDELILPLLHRMTNLEELDLCLNVYRKKTFVDGNELKINIINKMPRLVKFTFNIRSHTKFYNQINLPSNRDIQYSFKDFTESQIISCVDYFQERNSSKCHIYCYPYRLKHYNEITNNFPGGLFTCVREVSLYDEQPFEHEFFLGIARSFPLLEMLTVVNEKPQKNKRCRKSGNHGQNLLVIEYPHLIDLYLNEAHSDYAEQFLINTKTSLPDDVHLHVDYQQLKQVTHNFKRHATRINCLKINCVYSDENSRVSKRFVEYFKTTENIY